MDARHAQMPLMHRIPAWCTDCSENSCQHSQYLGRRPSGAAAAALGAKAAYEQCRLKTRKPHPHHGRMQVRGPTSCSTTIIVHGLVAALRDLHCSLVAALVQIHALSPASLSQPLDCCLENEPLQSTGHQGGKTQEVLKHKSRQNTKAQCWWTTRFHSQATCAVIFVQRAVADSTDSMHNSILVSVGWFGMWNTHPLVRTQEG